MPDKEPDTGRDEEQEESLVWDSIPDEEVMSRISAVVAAVPYVGGLISAFMQAGMQKKALSRVEEMFAEMAARLTQLESQGRVSESASSLGESDQFQELTLSAAVAVSREASREKRILFRRFLTRLVAVGEVPGIRERQVLAALQQVDLSHLAALRGLADGARSEGPTTDQPWYGDVVAVLGGAFDAEIEPILADLQSWGLVRDKGIGTYDGVEDLQITQRGADLILDITEEATDHGA